GISGSDLCVVSAGDLDGTGDVSFVHFGISGVGDFVGRAAVGAHHSFLRYLAAGDFSGGACGDDCDGGILEPHAGNVYGPRWVNGGARMNPISRRKLITGGVAAAAGISGLAA